MACNTVLYNWSLRGEAPERLNVKPADAWPGNVEFGPLAARLRWRATRFHCRAAAGNRWG